MNKDILKLKAEAEQLRQLAAERALTAEENERATRIAEQVRCAKLASDAASIDIKADDANLAFAEAACRAKASNEAIEVRATTDKAGVEPMTPVNVGEILVPIEKYTVLDKVGVHIQYGLKGDWKYPVLAACEASIAGESAAISDTALSLSKVAPTPQRVALSIAVTNEAMFASNYDLKDIVLDQLQKAGSRLLNKWMFNSSAITTGASGPFVAPATTATTATVNAITYAEVQSLYASVNATNIVKDGSAAYVCNNATAAILRSTPKSSSVAAGFIMENDMIDGIPVFVTEYVDINALYFGYFSYCLIGQFGETSLIVDPYTIANANQVRFVLNTHFDIKSASASAFGKLTVKAS